MDTKQSFFEESQNILHLNIVQMTSQEPLSAMDLSFMTADFNLSTKTSFVLKDWGGVDLALWSPLQAVMEMTCVKCV